MKRIVPVLVAAAALATPAAAGAATNSVDITYDPAACTASIAVGLGQHLDPRLEWFQTIDDHRAGPTLTVTPYFVDSPHVEPIPLLVIRDGRPHRYWVRAVLRDDRGRRIGEGARTTELTCSPVVPRPRSCRSASAAARRHHGRAGSPDRACGSGHPRHPPHTAAGCG
jgi:hypothetical protein